MLKSAENVQASAVWGSIFEPRLGRAKEHRESNGFHRDCFAREFVSLGPLDSSGVPHCQSCSEQNLGAKL